MLKLKTITDLIVRHVAPIAIMFVSVALTILLVIGLILLMSTYANAYTTLPGLQPYGLEQEESIVYEYNPSIYIPDEPLPMPSYQQPRSRYLESLKQQPRTKFDHNRLLEKEILIRESIMRQGQILDEIAIRQHYGFTDCAKYTPACQRNNRP